MEENENVTKQAIRRRLESLQKEFNAKEEVMNEYLDRFAAIIKDSSDDTRVELLDIYRILAITTARLTTSTYHESEAEFQAEARLAHDRVNLFFKDFLKQGSPDANQEDFKISRLMMFSSDLVETVMWNFFLTTQPKEKMDLTKYLEEEATDKED